MQSPRSNQERTKSTDKAEHQCKSNHGITQQPINPHHRSTHNLIREKKTKKKRIDLAGKSNPKTHIKSITLIEAGARRREAEEERKRRHGRNLQAMRMRMRTSKSIRMSKAEVKSDEEVEMLVKRIAFSIGVIL